MKLHQLVTMATNQALPFSFLDSLAGAAFGIGTAAIIIRALNGGQGHYLGRIGPVDPRLRADQFNRYRVFINEFVPVGTHYILPFFLKPFIYNLHRFSSLSTTKDLQMVNLTLRLISLPHVSYLPPSLSILGTDYDQKLLPSMCNEVSKDVVSKFNANQLLTEQPHVSALVRESLISRAKDDCNMELDDMAITHMCCSGVGEHEQTAERKITILTTLF